MFLVKEKKGEFINSKIIKITFLAGMIIVINIYLKMLFIKYFFLFNIKYKE